MMKTGIASVNHAVLFAAHEETRLVARNRRAVAWLVGLALGIVLAVSTVRLLSSVKTVPAQDVVTVSYALEAYRI